MDQKNILPRGIAKPIEQQSDGTWIVRHHFRVVGTSENGEELVTFASSDYFGLTLVRGWFPSLFLYPYRTFQLYISTILCNPSKEFVDSCVVDWKDYKKGSLVSCL